MRGKEFPIVLLVRCDDASNEKRTNLGFKEMPKIGLAMDSRSDGIGKSSKCSRIFEVRSRTGSQGCLERMGERVDPCRKNPGLIDKRGDIGPSGLFKSAAKKAEVSADGSKKVRQFRALSVWNPRVERTLKWLPVDAARGEVLRGCRSQSITGRCGRRAKKSGYSNTILPQCCFYCLNNRFLLAKFEWQESEDHLFLGFIDFVENQLIRILNGKGSICGI